MKALTVLFYLLFGVANFATAQSVGSAGTPQAANGSGGFQALSPIPASAGGTGTDSSSANGCPMLTSGVWTYSSTACGAAIYVKNYPNFTAARNAADANPAAVIYLASTDVAQLPGNDNYDGAAWAITQPTYVHCDKGATLVVPTSTTSEGIYIGSSNVVFDGDCTVTYSGTSGPMVMRIRPIDTNNNGGSNISVGGITATGHFGSFTEQRQDAVITNLTIHDISYTSTYDSTNWPLLFTCYDGLYLNNLHVNGALISGSSSAALELRNGGGANFFHIPCLARNAQINGGALTSGQEFALEAGIFDDPPPAWSTTSAFVPQGYMVSYNGANYIAIHGVSANNGNPTVDTTHYALYTEPVVPHNILVNGTQIIVPPLPSGQTHWGGGISWGGGVASAYDTGVVYTYAPGSSVQFAMTEFAGCNQCGESKATYPPGSQAPLQISQYADTISVQDVTCLQCETAVYINTNGTNVINNVNITGLRYQADSNHNAAVYIQSQTTGGLNHIVIDKLDADENSSDKSAGACVYTELDGSAILNDVQVLHPSCVNSSTVWNQNGDTNGILLWPQTTNVGNYQNGNPGTSTTYVSGGDIYLYRNLHVPVGYIGTTYMVLCDFNNCGSTVTVSKPAGKDGVLSFDRGFYAGDAQAMAKLLSFYPANTTVPTGACNTDSTSPNGAVFFAQDGNHGTCFNGNYIVRDQSGTATLSGGTTTVTFAWPFPSKPSCRANDETALALVKVTPSTTTVILTGTSNDVIDWDCKVPTQ